MFDKVKVILYQYFDNNEATIKNRIVDITNRINKSQSEYDIKDLFELHNLMVESNTMRKVERQLNELLNF